MRSVTISLLACFHHRAGGIHWKCATLNSFGAAGGHVPLRKKAAQFTCTAFTYLIWLYCYFAALGFSPKLNLIGTLLFLGDTLT